MKQVLLIPFLAGLALCLLCAWTPLAERDAFDAANTKLLIAVDLEEVASVARAMGRSPADELARYAEVGVNACVTTTHTLSELDALGEVRAEPGALATRLTIKDPGDPYRVRPFLERLLPGTHAEGAQLVVPSAGPLLMDMKAFRDHRLEQRARELGMTPIYRMNSAPWAGPAYVDAVLADIPPGAVVVFDEKQVLGWPSNTKPALAGLRERNAAVCVVEFAGQVGVREMVEDGGLACALLHSISRPEMAKLNLERILPRWIRAAAERNTRVMVAHLFPHTNLPYPGLDVSAANVRYLKETAAALEQAGFTPGPPELRHTTFDIKRAQADAGSAPTPSGSQSGPPSTPPPFDIKRVEAPTAGTPDPFDIKRAQGPAAGTPDPFDIKRAQGPGGGQGARFEHGRGRARVAVGAALWLLVAWLLLMLEVLPARAALVVALPVWPGTVGLLVMKPVLGAKLAALALGSLTPAAATLLVYRGVIATPPDAGTGRLFMDSAARAVVMLALCLTGGLLLSATLTSELFVFRLEDFLGVKLVYLSGPGAAVIGYLWLHRVNPLARPLLVRDVALVGAVALAGVIYILRSGNFISVSATGSVEYAVRDAIQGFVAVRPRTKELLVGYPGLVLLGFAYAWRDRLWTPFLLLATSVSAVSAVNSFCHIHSPPLMSAARGAIALAPGLVIGALAVPLFALLAHVPRRPLVTLSGYFGYGNFGDELILAHAMRLIRETLGERVEVLPFTRERRRAPWAMFAALRQSVAHVSLGGGLFQDTTGLLTPFYYAAFLVLSRLMLVPRVLVAAQSFSIRRRWVADLVARALAPVDLLMTRDAASSDTLRRWGLDPETGADLSCWYPPTPAVMRDKPATVGISLRPLPGGKSLRGLAEALAAFAVERGLAVVWLSFQPEQDRPLLEPLGRVVDVTVENHADVLAGLDLVIATRYHAMLLSILAGLPVFALSYDSKTEALLDELASTARFRPGVDPDGELAARLAAWAGDLGAAREQSLRAGSKLRERGAAARERMRAMLVGLEPELAASEADVVRDPVVIAATTSGSGA